MVSLQQLHQLCKRKNIAVVSYQLPGTSEVLSLIQTTPSSPPLATIIDQQGFYITTFDNSQSYFIQPDVIVENGMLSQQHQQLLEALPDVDSTPTTLPYIATEAAHIDAVKKAITAIEQGTINKVIVSRAHAVDRPADFSATKLFNQLCEQYHHAFVYLIQLPNEAPWMGASPETLASIHNNAIHTVALAGTQARGNTPIDAIEWQAKEQHEQAVVAEYIEALLQQHGATNYQQQGPYTSAAANVVHLKTDYHIPTDQVKSAGNFIQALHPTPAVCGLPKTDAMEFIAHHEAHNRKFYAGFLGPVNLPHTHFFVNLRCMSIHQQQLALYVGGGITRNSNPQKEWDETMLKAHTLLSVIEKM